MDSKLKTAPTDKPITLTEAKTQLNIETAFTDDDTLIGTYIESAVAWLQDQLQLQLMQAEWYLVMNAWQYEKDYYLELPWSPLVTVSSIQYYDESNVLQTLSTSLYQVYTYSMPGKVRFIGSLPSLYDRPDAIIITYTAGHGAAAANAAAQQAAVPQLAKEIIKVLVTDFYEYRGEEYKATDRVKVLMSTLKVFLKC